MRHVVNLTIGLLLIAGIVGISQFQWRWYWIFPFFCAGVLLNYWSERLQTAAQRRTANQTTSRRQSFAFDDFVSKHFVSDQVNIAKTVLDVFAEVQGIDWNRVLPDDHFTRDLGMDKSDLMSCFYGLHEHYEIELPHHPLDHLVNLRSVVEWIWAEQNR